MRESRKHLPLYGVGPVIIFGQGVITTIAICFTHIFAVGFASFDILKIPFFIVGVLLIVFGCYLALSAWYKSELFKNVKENKLVTDGVYAYTRNPVYSGAFFICAGVIFIMKNFQSTCIMSGGTGYEDRDKIV